MVICTLVSVVVRVGFIGCCWWRFFVLRSKSFLIQFIKMIRLRKVHAWHIFLALESTRRKSKKIVDFYSCNVSGILPEKPRKFIYELPRTGNDGLFMMEKGAWAGSASDIGWLEPWNILRRIKSSLNICENDIRWKSNERIVNTKVIDFLYHCLWISIRIVFTGCVV